MRQYTATDFARHFGRIREEVHQSPIAVTTHNRVAGYFISAEDYATLQRAKERKSLVVGALPDDVLTALQEARMDERHDHLNSLME